ncbi:hypothetical protein CVV65_01845 [Kyrpidia spormannii]|uniref:Uncharacterized protein n=1 Tax=Kyrpidia spormannii TaxID=2055160 RepID=A0A2K8N3V3_9BACL|nr:PepSY domain-containing protein [Kyrpidia spormannii]ATY83865.1 hypothetical protein CVV65_01845 [Kyrpidia spormannii]
MKRFSKIAVSAATLAVLSTGYPVPSGPVHAAPGQVPGPAAAPDSVTTPDTVAPAGQTGTPPVASAVPPTVPPTKAPTPPPNAISEKEAVAKVRALFDGLGEFPYVTAYYLPGDPRAGIFMGSRPTWDLTFFATDPSKFQGPPSEPPDTLNARVDAITGAILDFSRMNPAWTGDRQPDNQLALQAATAFLQKVGSPFRDQGLERIGGGGITQTATPGTKTLQWRFAVVTFSEKVHGIPFPQNSLDIRVDQFGHVIGMQIMHPFDSSKLPDPSGAISSDEAQKLLAAQLQLEKMYLTTPFHLDSSGQLQKGDRPVLGYFPMRQGSIDAFSGKPFTGGLSIPPNMEMNKTLSIIGQGQALQAKDKDTAARLVADFLHMDLSGMTFEEQTPPPDTLSGYHPRVLTWSLRPPASSPAAQGSTIAPAEQPSHINAVFDADTGQWLDLNVDTQMLRGKPAVLSMEQGEAKALSFLQQILPKGSQTVQLVWEMDGSKPLPSPPDWFDPAKDPNFMPEPLPVYTYIFRPLVQGVPILDRIYNVQVDATTGRIVGFTLPPASSPALPDNRDTITPEQAKTAFLQAQPIRLVYTWPAFGNQAAPQGQLVYEFDPNHPIQYIDAFTGKLAFFGGR